MAENFNLIFGSNAPDSTTWSDADYQTGWATVGPTPPTAEQFDFLQNRADLKAKELKDTIDPLVQKATEEGRQPSTAYVLGDKTIHPDLPYGWYLRCVTAGITDSADITIPPLSLNAQINDGTVVWELSNITQAETNFNGQFLAGFSGLFIANADIYYTAGTFPTNTATTGLPGANYGFLEIISSSPYGFNSNGFFTQIYTNIASNKRYIRSVFHPSSVGAGWSAWSVLN